MEEIVSLLAAAGRPTSATDDHAKHAQAGQSGGEYDGRSEDDLENRPDQAGEQDGRAGEHDKAGNSDQGVRGEFQRADVEDPGELQDGQQGPEPSPDLAGAGERVGELAATPVGVCPGQARVVSGPLSAWRAGKRRAAVPGVRLGIGAVYHAADLAAARVGALTQSCRKHARAGAGVGGYTAVQPSSGVVLC